MTTTARRMTYEDLMALYLAGGARLVWLLYPRTCTAQIFMGDGTIQTIPADGRLDGDEVLPGFSVTLADLFA